MGRDEDEDFDKRTTRIPKDLLSTLAAPRDRAFLIVYHRNGAELVTLRPDVPLVIGRDALADVPVLETNVSRQHARFLFAGGKVSVEDLGSTNGTEVHGKRVEQADLALGDEVLLGGVRVSVHGDGRLDGLESHERFRAALEQEVERARLFERGLAVLRVRASRADVHVSRFGARVRALLRAIDRAAIYSGGAVEILCPELAADRAHDVAREIVACAPDVGPLLVGISMFPVAASNAEELVESSAHAAERASESSPVHAARSLGWQPEEASPRSARVAEPVIASAGLRKVFQHVALLGKTSLPVLIHGETGTGKEVVARAIHDQSPRRGKRMLVVNCGAIPAQLVESTLFGHMKGSFTGAMQDQKGVFEAADRGTVFLDEIGELSAAAQAAFLRVLDAGTVTRVGSTREIKVDVRVVAATHRSLEAMCDKGTFRLDLLYRLNGTMITIPPLCERPEDLEPLVQRFLIEANEAAGRSILGFTPSAQALLAGYPWPGNVRELRNAVHRAVAIAQGDRIAEEDLPERVLRLAARREPEVSPPASPPLSSGSGPSGVSAASLGREGLKAMLRNHEIQLILDALQICQGNQTEAARLLKVPLRTLAHKIKTLGIKKRGFGVN